jgi:hypothetical protein
MFSGNNFSTNDSTKSVIAIAITWLNVGIFIAIAYPLKNCFRFEGGLTVGKNKQAA